MSDSKEFKRCELPAPEIKEIFSAPNMYLNVFQQHRPDATRGRLLRQRLLPVFFISSRFGKSFKWLQHSADGGLWTLSEEIIWSNLDTHDLKLNLEGLTFKPAC